MPQQRLVEDGVDGGPVVVTAFRLAADSRAFRGRCRGWHPSIVTDGLSRHGMLSGEISLYPLALTNTSSIACWDGSRAGAGDPQAGGDRAVGADGPRSPS